MQALESIKVLFKHIDFSGLHFGHRWLTHFGCVSGFSRFCQTSFGWNFISRHGTYRWSSSIGRCLGCFRHFDFICSSLTFLSHKNNTFFFFLIFFYRFWQGNYVGMWGHYGSKIVRIFSGPFSEVSCSTTDIPWWYRPSFYGRLCPICFSRELHFGGSIFVF